MIGYSYFSSPSNPTDGRLKGIGLQKLAAFHEDFRYDAPLRMIAVDRKARLASHTL